MLRSTTHSLLGRALHALVPTGFPSPSRWKRAFDTPTGFPSPLRGGVRGGGNNGGGIQHKASRAGPLLAFEALRQPVWSPRDYAAFAREGFAQNAIVYRCVRMIAEAAASVPLLLYEGEHEIAEHPLLDLLARPNPVSSTPDLLEAWYGFLLVSGNAYLEAVALDGAVRELHALRPDRMKVIPGPDGWPEAFEYTAGGRAVRYTNEVAPGVRPILHVKLFHPVNDHYGLSPIEAAATAIDIHNTASRWNKALLDNSARPSGALVYTARDGNLSPEQVDRLKAELEQGFQGAAHAGRPLLLEGGLDWKSMSLSPKDMDFIEAKHAAAREIALALGVPPMLLAIPGDNTYSNYQEANRSFWRQTVLPLVNRTAKALSAWLAPAYAALPPLPASGERAGVRGGGRLGTLLELRPDLDAIEALSPEREALWSRLEKATFLTPDEKRAAVGYGPLEVSTPLPDPRGGQKFNPNHDALGRFTTGDSGGTRLAQGRFRRPPPTKPVPVPPGATIRNKDLAGKKHPDTGIPFDSDGFPDFSSVATRTVKVPHTGTTADTASANRAAGFASTPPGMVWHHHQDGHTMQLVPQDIHARTGHTGSRGIGNLPGKR